METWKQKIDLIIVFFLLFEKCAGKTKKGGRMAKAGGMDSHAVYFKFDEKAFVVLGDA